MDPVALSVFATSLLLIAGMPGPSITALVSRVIARGPREVIPFVAAMWIGEVIWLTMAMAGLSTLAQTFQFGFSLLKWAGAVYLCWLAWKMWRQPVEENVNTLPERGSGWSMFATGMALTLGHPKIMVFYLVLLPSIIDLQTADLGEWAILAMTTLTCLAVVDLAWIALAARARRFLVTAKARRAANRVGAVSLGGAAAMIAIR